MFINMDKDPNRVKDLHFNDISISACESEEHLGTGLVETVTVQTLIEQ